MNLGIGLPPATQPANAKKSLVRTGLARAWASITGDSPSIAGIDLVARKGLPQQMRVGRSLSGNLPAVLWKELLEKATAFYVNDGHGTNRATSGATGPYGAIPWAPPSDSEEVIALAR